MKNIGPSFASELAAAGVSGGVAWNESGAIFYSDDVPDEQRNAVEAVYAAHDSGALQSVSVPQVVSRYQGREAMFLTRFAKEGSPGWTLLNAFEELLSAPTTPAYYRRAWEQLQVFERSSAMLNAAADVLGVSQGKLDDLFRLAAALKA